MHFCSYVEIKLRKSRRKTAEALMADLVYVEVTSEEQRSIAEF